MPARRPSPCAAFCLFVIAAAAVVLPSTARADAPSSRPNIVLMYADDLGYGDVGCFGSADIRTPQLDKLAGDGARLTSWYAQPVCTPSRYALLTGRHPNRTRGGLMPALMRAESYDDDKGLMPGETTIAERLQAAGYRTAIVGKWHLGHGRPEFLPTRHGFDTFYGHLGGCVDFFTLRYGNIPDWYRGETLVDKPGYATDVVTDEAVRVIGEQSADRPFFLLLTYAAPHYAKGWDAAKGELTNELQAKPETIAKLTHIEDHDRRVFAAMVTELDAAVGQVLAALDDAGLAENTWVIFASDNGGDLDFGGRNDPLNGEKNTLWEGGVRTPCIMRWPGRIAAGTTIEQPLAVQDFYPTVCGLAGLPTGDGPLDGVDMRPALFENRPVERDVFYLRDGNAALRRGDWKYLKIDGKEMLFNLADDLGEQHDLAAANPEKLAELKAAHQTIAATFE